MKKKKTTARKKSTARKKTTAKKKSPQVAKHAAKYLKDVPPDKCFWVSNGWIIRNMGELPPALDNMNDDTFAHHVNNERNDFSMWVKEVIGDRTLAMALGRAKSRNGAIQSVNKRITNLKG